LEFEEDRMQLADLTNKRCLITGGTRGIGEATARLFEERGAEVVIIGRDRRRGEMIQKESKKIKYRQVDLENLDNVRAFLHWFDSEYGRLDILINNASRDSRYTLLDIPMEEWDSMIKLNLTSPYLICKSAAQKMISQDTKGKIILVGAIQAFYPLERSFGYVATKGGLISMMKSMAVDLGKFGIQVIALLPGPIYIKDGEVPASLDQRAAPLLGRMGRKDEVAKVLAFLASDDNSFMTGNYVIVDGGRIISRKADPIEISGAP
jgi:NAD(P)-dependent dehydrogenase (short-subunit alcohol dehydrogenase family)